MSDHQAKLIWRNGMVFDTISDNKAHLQLPQSSGHETPEEEQQGFSPMGLVLAALAGCTAMDVLSILKKKRQTVTAFEVEVLGEQADEHPRVYRKISVLYRVSGPNLDPVAVDRAIELSVTKYCPVNAMLREVAEMTYRAEILHPVEP